MATTPYPEVLTSLEAAAGLGVAIDFLSAVAMPQMWALQEAVGRTDLREECGLPGTGVVTRLRNAVNGNIGPSTWSIAIWLVNRARTAGLHRAVEELAAYARDSAHDYQCVLAVQGPIVKEKLRLNDRLDLLPWSEAAQLVGKLGDAPEHPHDGPSSALVLRLQWQDGQCSLPDPHPFAVLKTATWALFAASGVGVASGDATIVLPPQVPTSESFLLPFGTRKLWSAHGVIGAESAALAGELHCKLCHADHAFLETVQIVADRTSFAVGAEALVDRYIDLGIASEVLFLHGQQSELTFRLALHAARFTGTEALDRKRIFDDFKQLYKRRSKAVHTGRTDKLSKEDLALTSRVVETIARGLRRAIQEGFPESWDDLVLK